MKWFYTKLGKNLEHGLVEDEVLHDMASKEQLSREDLIWAEESGAGWALAETLHGLFPEQEKPAIEVDIEEPEEEILPIQARNYHQKQQQEQKKTKQKKKGRGFRFVLLLCLIAACLYFRESILKLLPAGIKENLPMLVDEEEVAAAEKKAVEEQARAQAEKVAADGKERLGLLRANLNAGKLDKAGAREMMNLWFEYGDLGQLLKHLGNMLDSDEGVTDSVYLSITYTAAVVYDKELILQAINDYQAGLIEVSSSSICVEMARLCEDKLSASRSTELLQAFLVKQPKASEPWLELAAMQTLAKDEKAALSSLKNACQFGNSATKEKASVDKRFDSIRETALFQRYMTD